MKLEQYNDLTPLSLHEMSEINGGTDGGATFAYYAGQVVGWGINVIKGFYLGAKESSETMPGLK